MRFPEPPPTLDGLLYLPEDVAEAIARHEGTLLTFESLRFLSDGAAKTLAAYGGKAEMQVVEVLHGTLPRIACTNTESGRSVESVKLSAGGVACPRKNG